MDTLKKTEELILDFSSFIKKYFDWYKIDSYNQKIISDLGLWATRNEKFNDRSPGWHIDRGIILIGQVGVGKDELFRMLNHYLKYLKSPYVFDHRVVWSYAATFTEDGYNAFLGEGKQNRWYEELALTDDRTNEPTREFVNHFGNKLLIGAELIHKTYDAFKIYGYQSHFSTNVPEKQLGDIYGARAFSRLKEMCNFMVYTGVDRRLTNTPTFLQNRNQPPAPPRPKEIDPDVVRENIATMEAAYQTFLKTKELPDMAWMMYNLLVAYEVQVCSEDEMRVHMECVAPLYKAPIRAKTSRNEAESERKTFIWSEARKVALGNFYQRLSDKNCKSIFGERPVANKEILIGKPGDQE